MSGVGSTILLVEDNEDDVFAMRRALKRARISNPLQVVTDGQQALDYLGGTGQFADRSRFPLPFIVFLDIKLPYVNGFEVLEWKRQQTSLEAMAIVVLTSSAEDRDHERAYSLGARSYLVKPPDADSILSVLESLQPFWLSKSNSTPIASEATG